MSKKHNFSFEGGNHLSRIGATYYVCYLYYLNCDSKEKRWEEVKTTILRNKKIEKYSCYSSLCLERISDMKKIHTNSMGLILDEVKNTLHVY